MSVEVSAKEHFRGPDKLNCAQAVLKVFQFCSEMTDDEIALYTNAGGGRAPDGFCGALYAAGILLNDGVLADKLKAEFRHTAAGITCKAIRAGKKLSCADCVVLAAKFVDQHK